MKYRTEVVRDGELLGPIDWDFDFEGHGARAEQVDWLRQVASDPDAFQVTNYGGWPRCGWGDVIAIGMYDGWPYWKPVPSILRQSVLGGEWMSVNSLTDILRKDSL